MIKPIDFSERKTFPGVEKNFLDIILHFTENLNNIPSSLVALILILFSVISAPNNLFMTFTIFSFFILDWLLVKSLEIYKFSFGPHKSQLLELAILRSFFAIIIPFDFIVLSLQAIGTLLIIYGFFIEPQRIKIKKQSYETNLFKAGNAIRMLHLSDLHIERYSRREILLQKMIEDLKPDLIVFTGDILNLSYLEDHQSWQDARQMIQKWQAPLGVYGVFGSPAVDIRENMAQLCKDLPIRWLDNEQVSINVNQDQIDLIGLPCSHRPFIDFPALKSFYQNNPNNLQILLYHSPDLAPDVAKSTEIHIQLSGHTHGGQICLPFLGAFITGSLYGKVFQSGLYQLNQLTLYISRGIGLEGCGAPRVRFLCPPEIILWDIHSSES